MFLSNKSTKPQKRTRGKAKRSQKREDAAIAPKLIVANQVMRVTVPRSVFSGEDGELVRKEEISVRIFVTEPAKVGAQWMWSAEEVKETGKGKLESEWHGFRISIEVPCYVERVEEVKREVIEEVKREAEQQKREFVARSTKQTFGSDTDKADLGLV